MHAYFEKYKKEENYLVYQLSNTIAVNTLLDSLSSNFFSTYRSLFHRSILYFPIQKIPCSNQTATLISSLCLLFSHFYPFTRGIPSICYISVCLYSTYLSKSLLNAKFSMAQLDFFFLMVLIKYILFHTL